MTDEPDVRPEDALKAAQPELSEYDNLDPEPKVGMIREHLVERAEDVGWRAVGVSGTGATVAGVTATAVQDNSGDGSWTLDTGAAVKPEAGRVRYIGEF